MMDPAILAALVAKSKSKLAAATLLFNARQYDDSVSRAYYAVFHSLTAIHLKNAGVIIGAIEHYLSH